MCGRFALSAKTGEIEKLVPGCKIQGEIKPRYNIAPAQDILAVINGRERTSIMLRWGLIPFWAKDASIGNKLINARSETLLEKPSFKHSFKKRRCLVFADGFYEWKKITGGSRKAPHFIKMKTGEPFAFAGLWEKWRDPAGNLISSGTIITTSPNELVKQIHNRMPVILDSECREVWLEWGDVPADVLLECLKPFPADLMEAFEVSTFVNNPSYDDDRCIEPLNEFLR